MAALTPPCLQLRLVGVHAGELIVRLAMNRQALVLLPALDSANVLLQKGGNLLPGVQPLFAFSPRIFPTVSHRLILLRSAIRNKQSGKEGRTVASEACRSFPDSLYGRQTLAPAPHADEFTRQRSVPNR